MRFIGSTDSINPRPAIRTEGSASFNCKRAKVSRSGLIIGLIKERAVARTIAGLAESCASSSNAGNALMSSVAPASNVVP